MVVNEKVKAEEKPKTSVKSYMQDIKAKKQKFGTYSKKMATNVATMQTDTKELKNEFKKYTKEIKGAAQKIREQGVKKMAQKKEKFKEEIKDQIKENKEAVTRISNGVRFLIKEIDKKREDFQSYAHGAFQECINAFWGR